MAILQRAFGAASLSTSPRSTLWRVRFGTLYPDVVRAGDGGEDAHARRSERERDVLLERRDAEAHAHAGGQVDA